MHSKIYVIFLVLLKGGKNLPENQILSETTCPMGWFHAEQSGHPTSCWGHAEKNNSVNLVTMSAPHPKVLTGALLLRLCPSGAGIEPRPLHIYHWQSFAAALTGTLEMAGGCGGRSGCKGVAARGSCSVRMQEALLGRACRRTICKFYGVGSDPGRCHRKHMEEEKTKAEAWTDHQTKATAKKVIILGRTFNVLLWPLPTSR